VETNARLSGRQVSAKTIEYPKIPMEFLGQLVG
jgi:hypothetical protein